MARGEDPGFYVHLERALAGAGVDLAAITELTAALTHASYVQEAADAAGHNERLEFLGDAFIGFCVAAELYARYPAMGPGEMTRRRAQLVSGEALAAAARRWRLGEELRLGRGEAGSGGRRKDSNLGSALEAVVGAVYRGAGPKAARAVVLALLGEALERAAAGPVDPKSALQEWAQARGLAPVYRILSRTGPDHAPVFEVAVVVGEAAARARGASRQAAEKEAAAGLLATLERGD